MNTNTDKKEWYSNLGSDEVIEELEKALKYLKDKIEYEKEAMAFDLAQEY